MWYKFEIDVTKNIKASKSGCSVCGENPCVCGSKAPKEKPYKECKSEDTHKNLEELAKKISPLVDEINEELERHAKVCKKTWGDKDAGYPPNCKKGFVEKDDKCIPVKKDEANMGLKKKLYSNLWKKVNNVEKN